jgi:D-beta-D-heptose 7-phosphate kinase/D-beta-D-heptose 1-phosphate adenosyltransferase
VEHGHRTIMQRQQPTVLVIGDVVCDVHLVGTVEEQDEAPVFSATAQYDALSGAAGTACDLKALGCDVRLLSVVGTDAVGRRMRDLLRQQSITDTLVLEDAGRPTAQRTHLSGNEGAVLCLEWRRRIAPSRALTSRLFECVDAVLPHVDGVLCAEDRMGLGDTDLCRLLSAAHAAGCPVFVGSRTRWSRCHGSSVHPVNGTMSLAEVAHELQQRCHSQAVTA